MNRRNLLRGAGATTLALVGVGAVTDCCCGSGCSCADACALCADCDAGGGDQPVEFE